ncbi:MAG: CBS domain-containing protein, partial [Verrucomicrobiia bacterium]
PARRLDYELLLALRPETRVVVLRMKRLRAVGSSAMAMLQHFHQLLSKRGIHLIVCGVEEEMTNVLTGSGVRSLIGEQNIFYADNRIFQSTELALARAHSIVEMGRTGQQESTSAAQREALQQITVASVMQKRCLRFGARHQMREAMWLISAFQQKMKTTYPQTVFLQNEEGRLSGEVSLRLILRQLAAEVPESQAAALDDVALGRRIRPRLFQSIETFALSDPLTLDVDTPLAVAFAKAARNRFRSMPVADAHGRLMGVFDELAMLRGLTRILQMATPGEPAPLQMQEPSAPSLSEGSDEVKKESKP